MRSNLRFWAGRESDVWGEPGSQRSRWAFRGIAVRGLPDVFLQQLLSNPDAVFSVRTRAQRFTNLDVAVLTCITTARSLSS